MSNEFLTKIHYKIKLSEAATVLKLPKMGFVCQHEFPSSNLLVSSVFFHFKSSHTSSTDNWEFSVTCIESCVLLSFKFNTGCYAWDNLPCFHNLKQFLKSKWFPYYITNPFLFFFLSLCVSVLFYPNFALNS